MSEFYNRFMRDHIRYRQSNIIRTIPLSSGPMRAATRKSSSDAATATKMGNINCLYCTETTWTNPWIQLLCRACHHVVTKKLAFCGRPAPLSSTRQFALVYILIKTNDFKKINKAEGVSATPAQPDDIERILVLRVVSQTGENQLIEE